MHEMTAPEIFDDHHYAATPLRKLVRSAQLGPKYYLLDLPRYFLYRRSLGLPAWDLGAVLNPFREFSGRAPRPFEEPPRYGEALEALAAQGVRMTMPPGRLRALAGAWWASRGVPGDVIECGAYRGATSLLIALLGAWNAVDQTTLMLDTFAGSPAPSGYDTARRGGEFAPPAGQVEVIERQAKALGIRDRVRVEAGLFTATFVRLRGEPLRFAFVHIDCNLFAATREACEFALPRGEPGGIAVFDDYNGACDLGARLAIDLHLFGVRPGVRTLCGSSAYWVIGQRRE